MAALPAFRFEEEPLGVVGGRLAADLAGIALPILLVVLPAAGWLRRYPVAG
jgi:hypothetical protein